MSLSITDASQNDLITAEVLTEITDLTAFLYAHLHLESDVALSIIVTEEDEMARLHLEWMDLPGPTDVMSFPMDELQPGTSEQPVTGGILGDIVLCPAVAEAQAAVAGHSVTDELLLLTTHGVLHLLGYDHEEASERAEMFGLQDRLLSEFLGRTAPTPTVS